MIETMRVIRCDADVALPPSASMNRKPRTVQCSRFYPARNDLYASWRSAQHKGWRQVQDDVQQPRQVCPMHAEHQQRGEVLQFTCTPGFAETDDPTARDARAE